MKNRNKRFTSVLAASMALGMMAPAMVSVAPVMAATDVIQGTEVTVGGMIYDITPASVDQTNNTVGIYNYQAKLIAPKNQAIDYSTLTIPATINAEINGNMETIPVTAIGREAFSGVETLRNLTIGKNVRSIGIRAFQNTSLVNVTIDATNATIGVYAFDSNSDLVNVNINGVININNRAFSNNPNLKYVTLNEGLKTIGDAAFYNDPALTTISLPSTVTTIGAKVFLDTYLTGNIQLPESLVSIGAVTATQAAPATAAGDTFATKAGSLQLTLPTNNSWIASEGKYNITTWVGNVFGFDNPSSQAQENYQIIGLGDAAPSYLTYGVAAGDDDFYVGTPYLNMSSKNASGNALFADNQNMQIVLGNSVNVYTFVPGTLTITGPDGKVTTQVYNKVPTGQTALLVNGNTATTATNLKDGFTNKGGATQYNVFELKTPQVGVTTIKFTALKGKVSSENTITVVANGNNAWIQENFEVPTNWTVGSEDRPSGAVAKYGEVEYVYSTTKGGTYTGQVPTTPGWYWVKAIVNPVEGSYNGLETEPVQFEMFAAGEFGGWVKSGNNWMYYNEDGEAVKDTTMEIDGDLYMFDANGIMQTGWKNTDAGWMFFDNAGHAKSGWLYDHEDDVWYYFDADHIMAKSTWVEDAGKQYYLTSSGAMAASRWLTKDGHDVYVDNSGALKTGWLAYNMNWYYLEPSTGYMATSGTVDGWNIQSNGIAVKA